MIEVKDKLITEPIIDILYDLRRDLIKENINKLNDIIVKGPNALITCIQHKNGQETHPSCYVRLDEGNQNVSEGFVHCFTCGYKAPLTVFISNCFGYDDKGEYGEEWLINHCNYSYLTERRILKKIEPKVIKKEEKCTEYVSEEELKSYRFYHPYMFQRKLTEQVINDFDIGFDKKTNCVTFPVYNKDNKCLFVVKRNVSFKKFYIPKNVDKEIFGLNHIKNNMNEIIICESVFNALTAWVYGKPAVALFGTGSEEQYQTLNNLNVRRYILMFDGDKAGRKGAERFKQNIKNKLITDIIMPTGKDVNDLSKQEFDNLLRKYGI